MMSCIGLPGRKIPFTPASRSFGMSTSGIIPPITTSTSSSPFSLSSCITRGQMCMCAPDRMDKPMASASSCSAAATICSGV